MSDMTAHNAASVKDRLKNLSKTSGKTMQELLVIYGLERTIYRLSKSKYADNFTLKGGIFLYALFEGNYVRATTDIDLLAQKISNGINAIENVFYEIFSMEVNDTLRFDLNTLKVASITEFKKYHGVNVSVKGYLERTRVDVSIDIGFGDVIYPDRVLLDFPVVLSDESPQIYAYSLVSSVAEKFEAIVSLAYDNSRFKDYYDIYILARKYDFNGRELYEAIRETFEYRHTSLNEIVAFEEGFADDAVRISRWKAFVKKKKAMVGIDLNEAIRVIALLLKPIIEALKTNSDFNYKWNCHKQRWIEIK